MEVIKLEVDAPEVHIVPIGDAQYGVPAFDQGALEEFLAGRPAGSLLLGMGDYVDGVSPSNRRKLRAMRASGELYDVVWSMLDDKAEEHMRGFLELVKHTRGKWMGMLEGHHYWVFGKGATGDIEPGETTDEWLSRRLATQFLGHSVIIEVTYGDGITRRIRAIHGETSASTEAGAINAMKKEAWTGADVVFMGHTHRKLAVPTTPTVGSIDPESEAGWRQRDQWLINTGSFLRGYLRGHETYVERKNLPPTHLGGVYFTFDRKGEGHVRL